MFPSKAPPSEAAQWLQAVKDYKVPTYGISRGHVLEFISKTPAQQLAILAEGGSKFLESLIDFIKRYQVEKTPIAPQSSSSRLSGASAFSAQNPQPSDNSVTGKDLTATLIETLNSDTAKSLTFDFIKHTQTAMTGTKFSVHVTDRIFSMREYELLVAVYQHIPPTNGIPDILGVRLAEQSFFNRLVETLPDARVRRTLAFFVKYFAEDVNTLSIFRRQLPSDFESKSPSLYAKISNLLHQHATATNPSATRSIKSVNSVSDDVQLTTVFASDFQDDTPALRDSVIHFWDGMTLNEVTLKQNDKFIIYPEIIEHDLVPQSPMPFPIAKWKALPTELAKAYWIALNETQLAQLLTGTSDDNIQWVFELLDDFIIPQQNVLKVLSDEQKIAIFIYFLTKKNIKQVKLFLGFDHERFFSKEENAQKVQDAFIVLLNDAFTKTDVNLQNERMELAKIFPGVQTAFINQLTPTMWSSICDTGETLARNVTDYIALNKNKILSSQIHTFMNEICKKNPARSFAAAKQIGVSPTDEMIKAAETDLRQYVAADNSPNAFDSKTVGMVVRHRGLLTDMTKFNAAVKNEKLTLPNMLKCVEQSDIDTFVRDVALPSDRYFIENTIISMGLQTPPMLLRAARGQLTLDFTNTRVATGSLTVSTLNVIIFVESIKRSTELFMEVLLLLDKNDLQCVLLNKDIGNYAFGVLKVDHYEILFEHLKNDTQTSLMLAAILLPKTIHRDSPENNGIFLMCLRHILIATILNEKLRSQAFAYMNGGAILDSLVKSSRKVEFKHFYVIFQKEFEKPAFANTLSVLHAQCFLTADDIKPMSNAQAGSTGSTVLLSQTQTSQPTAAHANLNHGNS